MTHSYPKLKKSMCIFCQFDNKRYPIPTSIHFDGMLQYSFKSLDRSIFSIPSSIAPIPSPFYRPLSPSIIPYGILTLPWPYPLPKLFFNIKPHPHFISFCKYQAIYCNYSYHLLPKQPNFVFCGSSHSDPPFFASPFFASPFFVLAFPLPFLLPPREREKVLKKRLNRCLE